MAHIVAGTTFSIWGWHTCLESVHSQLDSRQRSELHTRLSLPLLMSAWGGGSSARSCDELLRRVEAHDPTLRDLVILPLKSFGSQEVVRLARCLGGGTTGSGGFCHHSPQLLSLQASGHAVDDPAAMEALGVALAGPSCSLVTVAVGDSAMGDEGVCALCRGVVSGLRSSSSTGHLRLESIDLSWKGIGTDGLAAILGAFGDQRSLRSINLARNDRIGPSFDFCEPMSSSRPMFRNLTYLDLSECQLDATSCTTLLRAMRPLDDDGQTNEEEATNVIGDKRKLVLNLNSNDLSDTPKLNEMMNLVVHGSIVSELYISKCNLGDKGLQGTADLFFLRRLPIKSGPHLRRLDVSHNNLSPKGIGYFASTLLKSQRPNDSVIWQHALTNLHALSLAGNVLDFLSCEELAAAITSMALPSLEELDVSKTSCGVAGARALISSSVNTPLTTLNLFGNQLGSDGFLELSRVLRRGLCSLVTLDLGGNEASEAGVVALLQALTIEEEEKSFEKKSDFTLRLLVVGGNEGGMTLESVVGEITKIHPELDIARDKPRRNGGTTNNSTQPSGTAWMS